MMSDLKPSMGVLVVTETSIQEKLIPPFFLPPLSTRDQNHHQHIKEQLCFSGFAVSFVVLHHDHVYCNHLSSLFVATNCFPTSLQSCNIHCLSFEFQLEMEVCIYIYIIS